MDEPMTTFSESPEDPFSVRHAASAVLDGRGRVVGWSEQAHALLGYPAEEALGRSSVGFLVDPADYDVVMEAVSVCVRDAGWFGIVPVRRRDGGRVDLGCRVRPITRGGDPPCEWFLVGAPAAEVVQWETDRSVLDGLFRRSPIGLSVHATDLSILRVNRAVANFSRIPVEQHRGQRIGLYVVPQDTETVERQLREVLETGRSSISTEQPCRLAHDPTRELVVSVSAFRMEDPAGRVLGVTQTIEDVTERYRARYRLALLNDGPGRHPDHRGRDRAVPGPVPARPPQRGRCPHRDHAGRGEDGAGTRRGGGSRARRLRLRGPAGAGRPGGGTGAAAACRPPPGGGAVHAAGPARRAGRHVPGGPPGAGASGQPAGVVPGRAAPLPRHPPARDRRTGRTRPAGGDHRGSRSHRSHGRYGRCARPPRRCRHGSPGRTTGRHRYRRCRGPPRRHEVEEHRRPGRHRPARRHRAGRDTAGGRRTRPG
ncbi:PAS domain-containing protein [Streptomyces sp. CC210A]|uniref:PAS domain-containing protein n=1 Tax=Streptomyces sp. CC210A TaxID=2898184 RepID=UPI0027E4041A|nr:PAS domain-containing protein [Streptomyces sp. CC210A]